MPRVLAMHVDLGAVPTHRLRAEARRAHEPRHPTAAHSPARVDQEPIETRTPISFPVLDEEPHDLRRQHSVLLRMLALAATAPGIEATSRHAVAPAQ